jgi:hypothetical protein
LINNGFQFWRVDGTRTRDPRRDQIDIVTKALALNATLATLSVKGASAVRTHIGRLKLPTQPTAGGGGPD